MKLINAFLFIEDIYIYICMYIYRYIQNTNSNMKKETNKQVNKKKSNIWEVYTVGKSGICSTQVEIVLLQVIMKYEVSFTLLTFLLTVVTSMLASQLAEICVSYASTSYSVC